MDIKFNKFKINENWVTGEVDGGSYYFEAKLYDVGSQYGINGGRVSKLYLHECSPKKYFVEYDRGWGTEPTTSKQKEVFEKVLDFLENAPLNRFNDIK